MIDIEVEDPAWTHALPDAETLVRAAARAALNTSPDFGRGGPRRGGGGAAALPKDPTGPDVRSYRPLHPSGPPPPKSGEVVGSITLLLTDDASVRELNQRFRGQDAATNVLSFPAPANPQDHRGDIALAFGVCAREAAEQGKSLAHHLQHLTVHGVLHLLGYDHIGDDEAEAMEGLERAVLADLGISDPYAAGEGEHDRP